MTPDAMMPGSRPVPLRATSAPHAGRDTPRETIGSRYRLGDIEASGISRLLLTRHPSRPERLAVVDSTTGEARTWVGRDQDRTEIAAILSQAGYRLLPDGTVEEPERFRRSTR